MSASEALGWALLHFLWQGAAVAVALAVLLRATNDRSAATRYTLSVGALTVMLALPLGTAVRAHRAAVHAQVAVPATVRTTQPGAEGPATAKAFPRAPRVGEERPLGSVVRVVRRSLALVVRHEVERVWRALPVTLPWAVRIWFGGVVLLSLKLIGAWVQAQRLRRIATRPAPDACRALVARLAIRVRVARPIRVLESAVMQTPAVIGWLRPVLLVPASALTGLTAAQLEMLLAHELAHVQRHDYAVNLLQSVVETLLFYHPAVWWVSGRIRQEREHCCDDVAVSVGGDARSYAAALLEMEGLRAAPLRLAAAASGASLLPRVRRLLGGRQAHAELFPRWIAGVLGLTLALSFAGAARLWSDTTLPVSTPASNAEQAPTDAPTGGSSSSLAPDQLFLHPDPAAPLPGRWAWAHAEAKRRGLRSYCIGYTIRPLPGVKGSIYFGRLENGAITGPGIQLQGRLANFGGFKGFHMPGALLPAGLGVTDDVALLFMFEAQAGGETSLHRAHVTSLTLKVDLEGDPLLWLGRSDDGPSVALVQDLYSKVPDVELKADLVGVVGVHGTESLVVPILAARIGGHEPDDVRKETAEWLGRHPDRTALGALAHAARGDRSPEVRREAAESVGQMNLTEAGDSAIALARTLRDPDARREAVESLGERGDKSSLQALLDIARHDPDPDIEREAVETLGQRAGGGGIAYVEEIARTHPESDVRRHAAETLGQALTPADAERVLQDLLRHERHPDVQRQIVESLGQHLEPSRAVEVLGEVLRRGPGPEAQREAVETLGQLQGEVGVATVIETARHHADPEVRREAAETLARSAAPDKSIEVLREIARSDASEDVQASALEALAEVPDGAGIPALVELARSHPDRQMRKRALQVLVDSPDPRAQQLFDRALQRP